MDSLSSFDELVDDGMDSEIGELTDIVENCRNNDEKCSEYDSVIEEKQQNKSKNKNISPFLDSSLCDYDNINDKLTEIYNDFVKDTKITLANISNISQNEAYIKARWCSMMHAAKRNRDELLKKGNELREKIKQMVSEKSKNGAFLNKKMSVESVLGGDATLKEITKRYEESKMIYELYRDYYDIIKGLGFQIRNSIDTLNFERGM